MSASLNLLDDVGKSRRKNNTITNEGQPSNLLMVGKESFKIRKTPQAPTPMKTKPVVIYVVPPKVIHAEASEFMDVVQRLTGPTCSFSRDPQEDAQQRSHESEPISPEREEGATGEPQERQRYQEEEEECDEEEQKGGRLIVKNYMGDGVETQTHNDDTLHHPSPTTIPYIRYFNVFRKND